MATAAVFLLALAAAAMASPAKAAEQETHPPASVLYPVDAAGKLEGNDVYLPAPLLSKLLAESQRGKGAGLAATLVDARYAVILQRNESNGELACESATLILRCQAPQPNSRIDLPLQRNEAKWLGDQHTVDGAAVELIWNADGVGCTVALPRAGANELRLRCVPGAMIDAGKRRVQLHVPSVPMAMVEVIHPAGVGDLAVPSSLRVPRESHAARTVFRIPAGELLDVAWPAADRGVAPTLRVDQLTWLQVDPVAARVEVRLKLTGDAAALSELELATAPQLKLLPLAEDSPLQSLEPEPDSAATVRLKFRTKPQLPLELTLAFQVQRTMSVGRIAYPEVRMLGVATGQRHFAVTVDPRLRARDEPVQGFESAPATQLAELWGDDLGKPQLQFAVTGGAASWRLDVEPAPARFKQRDTLELRCESSHAHVDYAAELSDVEGEMWMHLASIPAEMIVDNVEVNGPESVDLVPLRWSRPRPEELQLILGVALEGAHVLRIAGRVPYGEGGRLPLPAIGLAESAALAVELTVARSSDVLVQWSDSTKSPKPLEDRPSPAESTGAIVGRYEVAARPNATTPELLVSPNSARFSADALVTLEVARSQSAATCIIVGRVTAGVVDHVRLLADRNWRGPFRVEPAATATVRTLPHENRQQLIDLHLAMPVAAGQELKLRVSGGVALAADQLLRMPEVRITGADAERTFVVLPDGEWALRGLRPEPLPNELAGALGATPRAVFQATGQFVAERRVFPEIMRTPTVPLVDTRTVVDDRGYCSAVSEVLLYPGRGGGVAIQLPQDAELLHASIDDRPVSLAGVENDLWQLPVGSRDLPRIVELSYRYRPVLVGNKLRLVPPLAIVDGRALWPKHALWQVANGADGAPRQPTAGEPLTKSEFATERDQAWIAVALQASPLAFQLPEWESREWFRPWLARLPIDAARQRPSGPTSPDDAAWTQLQTQLSELILAADGVDALPAATLAEKAVRGNASWFRAGRDGSLTLSHSSASSSSWRRWLLALAILAWAAAIGKHAARLAPLIDFVTRWPQSLGVAAGLAWWALLAPSWLGLAIALASCLAFFSPRYWGRAALSAGGPRYRADSAAEPVRPSALSRRRQ